MIKLLKSIYRNIIQGRKMDYSNIKIPARGDSWDKIIEFAQLIDGYKIKGSFKAAADIANRSKINKLSIEDLHVALFFEYRRYNHYGYGPDRESMEHIYKILDLLNYKVQHTRGGTGDATRPDAL
jgi:hypothetical protein